MPGSPLDPRAEGSNGLLKQGATLVTEASDIIDVLRPILGQPLDLPAQEPDADIPAAGEPDPDERERITGLLGPTAGVDRRPCPALREFSGDCADCSAGA